MTQMSTNLNISISTSRVSSDGTNIPLWKRIHEKGVTKIHKTSTAKEIITQLELSLGQPEEFVLGVIPGLSSFHTLEVFYVRKYRVKLMSKRSPAYLGKWFLSKLLLYGNLGNEERIVATFAFSKAKALEELFHLIDRRIKKRKTALLLQTYEFARKLQPNLFPRLPDTRDTNSSPNFLIVSEELKSRSITKTNRPRNPSAVGGKNRQEIAFLPTLSQTGHEAHNVVMIFLELEKLVRQGDSHSTDPTSAGSWWTVLTSPNKDENEK